jgi:hypothetical protein
MTTTAIAPNERVGKAKTAELKFEREPMKIGKRIGSTAFTVNVHYNAVNAESLEDIILRLIESEVVCNGA